MNESGNVKESGNDIGVVAKHNGARAPNDDDNNEIRDDDASSSSSSSSSTVSDQISTSTAASGDSKTTFVGTTQIKTLVRPSTAATASNSVDNGASGETEMRHDQQQQQQAKSRPIQANQHEEGRQFSSSRNRNHDGASSSSVSSSSTYKRYKFGLTNHFLTMPEVRGDQQDAKFYQKELNHGSVSQQHSPKSDLNNLPNSNNDRNEDDHHEDDDDDDCDLSVMGPSSPGSGASSLLSHEATWRSPTSSSSMRLNEPATISNLLAESSNLQHNRQLQHYTAHRHKSIEPLGLRQQHQDERKKKKKEKFERMLPAGDAGLDAGKCNSKAQTNNNEDCYLPPAATSPLSSSSSALSSSAYLNHHHSPAGGAKLNNVGMFDHHLTTGMSNGNPFGSPSGQMYHQHQHNSNKQHHLASHPTDDSSESTSNGLLVRFSSIIYATFLVILGCILHVSELRQKSKNSSDHIYTTIVALIGICWLVFLQTDLQRYKKYASKYILLESIFNDHHHHHHHQHQRAALSKSAADLASSGAAASLMLDPTARSTSSSSASLVNDRMSMNTEVIFKKTAYKMYQQRAAAMNQQQQDQQKDHTKLSQQPQLRAHDTHSLSGQSLATLSSLSSTVSSTLIPAYKFLHGKMGANFYLKCGMAAFCFGHVIHEGLRFGQQVYFFATGNVHCRDSAAMIAHLVTPLYSFYQLFMMFKYSNLVINRHKILAKFGLMHIIGTCVTFWFRTILEEAFEDFVHKMDYFKAQNKPINHYLDPTTASSFARDPTPPLSLFRLSSPLSSGQAGDQSGWLSGSVAAGLSTANSPYQTVILPGPRFATNLSLSGGDPHQNISGLAQSALFALMSSPISATITPQLVRNLPDSYHCAQNTLLTTKSMNALPYLYPFTIEYNLLIAATFLSLYFNIGKIGSSAATSSPSRCYPPASCKSSASPHQHNQPVSPSPSKLMHIGKQPSMNGSAHSYFGAGSAGSHYGVELFGSDQHHNNRCDNLDLNLAPSYYHQRSMTQVSPSKVGGVGGGGGGGADLGEYKSNFVVNADCHAANKGLFLGFFVLLVTLVTIVIFFVTINKPSHLQLGIKINLIQEATLTSLILIVTLAGYRQIMRLNKNPFIRDKVTTDDVLMLIPLPFFFIHSLLSFRAETATLYAPNHLTKSLLHHQHHHQQPTSLHHHHQGDQDSAAASILKLNETLGDGGGATSAANPRSQEHLQQVSLLQLSQALGLPAQGTLGRNQTGGQDGLSSSQRRATSTATNSNQQEELPKAQIDHFKLLTIALNVAVMIEVLIQTNFIIDGLRRCSESRYLRFKKPGRELITFAILLNITYWIVATFETKSVEQYKTEIEYYGPLPYMFISHTTLPVMLFYRYHSSVCLAEIWNRAYKSPKRR